MKTALISVSDKKGLEPFARYLTANGYEILSTGGTLKHLRECGIAAISIAEYTGQAEILGGRVKTLHPRIFGGILARHEDAGDIKTLESESIRPVSVVVVNLYPFEQTIAGGKATIAEAVEQIDIGGVSLIRAAAKNHATVMTITSPDDYDEAAAALEAGGETAAAARRKLAVRAFERTASYDAAIAAHLGGLEGYGAGAFPHRMTVAFEKVQDLRYGENPHQQAAFYRTSGSTESSPARARQIHGKELSYNNILDLDAALELVRSFSEPVCCIIKHNNPCGVARAQSLDSAWKAALECDPVSAFGGIVGFNREVDGQVAGHLSELFLEGVIAPSFAGDALEVLKKKKNLRLLETGPLTPAMPQPMLRSVIGGLLVQSRDLGAVEASQLKTVSVVQPTEDDIHALLFAWRVAKFVKSNAIVYTSRDATIGIGAGQMSRIDSTNIAAVKARNPIRGAYMASDAFFPFRDNVDQAAQMGIKSIIQPGGSMRDEEVIAAANDHRMVMVFTGMRHFRH